MNGLIMTWHDGAGRPPLWEMPVISEYQDEGIKEQVNRTRAAADRPRGAGEDMGVGS